MLTRKGKDLLAVATLMAAVAIAGALAIFRIEVNQTPVDFNLNPSPHGYTFSLALFIVPCAAFGIWLWLSRGTTEQRQAFLFTLILLISAWVHSRFVLRTHFPEVPEPRGHSGHPRSGLRFSKRCKRFVRAWLGAGAPYRGVRGAPLC
jgi:hypothetical protein